LEPAVSLGVFLAVIFAATLHALWNALLKHGADKYVGMTAVVIGHMPFAAAVIFFVPAPARESFPFILSAIALHFGYQLFLLWSYRIGDLTQVYPIARGTGPLIVTFVSIFGLGITFAPLELAGVLMIGLGLMSLSIVRQNGGVRNGKAAGLAFITGCFIASYSLNDGIGARLSGSPLSYFAWCALGNALAFSIAMMILKPGVMRTVLVEPTGHRAMLIGGGASYVAYSIVTWAFTQAPIALVTALRETSIIFALMIGVFFLREKLDLAKVISTFFTLMGAIMIRLAR
jgi:drug/metabolite transporter (DMT)-like permease